MFRDEKLKPLAINHAVQFLYTGSLIINMKNVPSLLAVAAFFGMDELKVGYFSEIYC